MIRFLGIAFILAATAATGMVMIGGVGAGMEQTRALQQLLLLMRSEMQYHLTPLPEIFSAAAQSIDSPVGALSWTIAGSMMSGQPQTAFFAIKSAMEKTPQLTLPKAAKDAFLDLSRSLGKYDLEGQLAAIDYCLERIEAIAGTLESERSARCRSYGAVCACAGVCFLILVL